MCYQVSLNKEPKDVKSPHMMSNLLGRGTADSRTRTGPFAYNPGRACTTRPPALEQRPGEGKCQARGRLQQGAAPSPGRGSRAGRAPSPGPAEPSLPHGRGARHSPLGSGCGPAHLLRLLPQRDAHGPEARLELGNVHPPVFVEVQFSEEVGVAGVAIPVPVAGGGRQKEASQELEHVGAEQRGQTRSVPRLPPAGCGRDTARDAASARSCQGRGEDGRGGPARARPAEGGRGAAGLAPPVPSPPPPSSPAAGREMRAAGKERPAAPRAPYSAPGRTDIFVTAQRFHAEKYHKPQKT